MYSAQIIIGAIVLFIVYRTIRTYQQGNLTRIFALIWLTFWGVVLFFLFQQGLLSKIANFLGVWRGVDLALYLSVITIFYLLFRFSASLEEVNQKITQIVRREALDNPTRKLKSKR